MANGKRRQAQGFQRGLSFLFGVLLVLSLLLFAACAKTGKNTLTFVTNGGSEIAPIEAEAGADITPPADPVRDGYVFDGWYLEEDLSGDRVSIPFKMPEESTTYYAKWTPAVTAKLTLSAGEGGTLAKAEYDVVVGQNLSAFLKNIAPTPTEGLEFAGWYEGSTALTEARTMPAAGLTLSAKYFAAYTVNVYRQNTDGSYPDTAETVTGKAIWGERFSYEPEEHYEFAEDKTQDSVREQLGIGETFTVYLARTEYYINYNVNAPRGVEAAREIPDVRIVYGLQATLADGNDFGLPASYRFAGWAETYNGEVKYAAGDTVTVEGGLRLFAKWETALTDAFGGGDYLFVSSTEEGVVYLRRAGLDEKKGSYDSAKSTFSFTEEGQEVLAGKTVGDCFYYYDDLTGKVFHYGNDTEEVQETIEFKGKDAVDYTVTTTVDGAPSSTVYHGVYSIDTNTGEYLFESEEKNFAFTVSVLVGEETTGEEYQFDRVTDDTLRGFYVYRMGEEAETGNLLFLDGMIDKNGYGGAAGYSYNEATGRYEAALVGIYELNEEESGTYAFRRATGEFIFYFRLASYAGNAHGVEFKGSFRTGDEFMGDYYDYADIDNAEEPALLLDGFGGCTYNGKAASYEIKTSEVYRMFSTASGNYNYVDSWIVVTEAGTGTQTILRLMSDYVYGNYYIIMHQAPYMEYWAHSAEKIYGQGYGSLAQNALFYYYLDDMVYIWSYYTDTTTGETIYEVVDAGSVEGNRGSYTFKTASSQEYLAGGQFDYKKVDGQIVTTYGMYFPSADPGSGSATVPTFEYGTGEDKLTIDKWGDAIYAGTTYAYGSYELTRLSDEAQGAFSVLTFTAEDTVLNYYVPEEGASRLLGDDEFVYLVDRSFPGQNDGFLHILLTKDAAGAYESAMLGLWGEDDSGLYEAFVIGGSVEEYEDGIYLFTLDPEKTFSGLSDSILGEFESFFFKMGTLEGKPAAILAFGDILEATGENGETLTLDGFGGATFTPAGEGATPVAGTYEYVEYDYESNYFVAVTFGSVVRYFCIIDDYPDTTFVERNGAETGTYAYLSDGGLYFPQYFTFFGDMTEEAGGGTVYTSLYDAFGYYIPTGETVELTHTTYIYETVGGWTEYTVMIILDEYAEEYVEFNLITAIVVANDGTQFRAFILRSEDEVLDYTVEGGGTLRGDGYNFTEYTVGNTTYYGNAQFVNVLDDEPVYDPAGRIEPSTREEAGSVLFYAYLQKVGNGQITELEEYGAYLFDIDTSLRLRDNVYGTYIEYYKGRTGERTLYLDGHGTAYVLDGTGRDLASGRYRKMEEIDEYTFYFESDDPAAVPSFRFLLGYNDEYYIYSDAQEEHLYVNDDWSVLLLAAFDDDGNNGRWVNEKGETVVGLYEYLTDGLVALTAEDGVSYYFDVNSNGTFRYNTDEYVCSEKILFAYQGYSNNIRIPDGVEEIAEYVFAVYPITVASFDLNDVKRVQPYAFYNMLGFNVTALNEENAGNLEWVGEAAFYFDGGRALGDTTLGMFDTLTTVNLPKIRYIGEYAFFGRNQVVSVVLGPDLEYIGEAALAHNDLDGGDPVTLDLTACDLAKVEIDPTAYRLLTGYSSTPEIYYDHILLKDVSALSYVSEWPEGAKQKITVAGGIDLNPIAEGTAFYDMAEGNYLVFGGESEYSGVFEIAGYVYDGWSSFSKDDTYGLYQPTAQGAKVYLKDENGIYTLAGTIGAADKVMGTYYRTETEHTVKLNEGADEVTFTFEVEVSELMFGTEISATVTAATYKNMSFEGNATLSLGRFDFDYTDEASSSVYTVEIDLVEQTGEFRLTKKVYTVNDGQYRITLAGYTADSGEFSRVEKFEVKNAEGAYDSVYTSYTSNITDGVCTFDVRDTQNSKITSYTVTVDGETITVATKVSVEKQFKTADEQYEATFLCEEGNETVMTSLTRFRVKGEYGFEELFGAEIAKTAENTFTVTVSSASESKEYTVTYANGAITVTVKTLRVVRAESAHDTNEDYYTVDLLVDENGTVVGITGEIKFYEYDNFSGSYGSGFAQATIESASSVTFENNVFTIEYFGQIFTVTVTVTQGEGGNTYSVAVSSRWAD